MAINNIILTGSVLALIGSGIYALYFLVLRERNLDIRRDKLVSVNMYKDWTKGYGKLWEQFAIPKGNMITVGVIPAITKIEGNLKEQKLMVFCIPKRNRKEYPDSDYRVSDVHYISSDPARITEGFKDTELGNFILSNAEQSKKQFELETLSARQQQESIRLLQSLRGEIPREQLIELKELFKTINEDKEMMKKAKK